MGIQVQQRKIPALEKIMAAISAVVAKQVFYAPIIFRWKIIENNVCPTIATDGPHLFYNREWIEDRPAWELETIILHEALHVALLHHIWAAHFEDSDLGLDHATWNESGDMEINDTIIDMPGFKMPDHGLRGKGTPYADKPAQRIYPTLLRSKGQQQQQQQQQGQQGQQGQGQGNDQQQQQGAGKGAANDTSDNSDNPGCASSGTDRGNGSDQRGGDPSPGADGPGGPPASDGGVDSTSPADVSSDSSTGGYTPEGLGADCRRAAQMGTVLPARTDRGERLTESQIRSYVKAIQDDLIASAAHCKARGIALTDDQQNMVDKIVAAKPETWRDRLEDFLTEAMHVGTTVARPRKALYSQGVLFPGRKRRKRGRLAIFDDGSGSVGRQIRRQFTEEIERILAELPECELEIITFASVVEYHETITSNDLPIGIKAASSGGTNYCNVFKYFERNVDEPVDAIIVLTDLLCGRYPPAPDVPVFWGFASERRDLKYALDRYGRPPFGEIVQLD